MAFQFQKQLKLGQLGEGIFARLNPSLTKLSGRDADFGGPEGTLELKTDFYTMSSTPNFFMERWYDVDKRKDGGPWTSYRKGVDKFVYFYVRDGYGYWFDTATLIATLENMITGMKPMRVVNKGWISEGYLIPRRNLARIYNEVKYDSSLYIGQLEDNSVPGRVGFAGGGKK